MFSKFINNKKGLDYAVLFALIVVPLALLFLFSQLTDIKGDNKILGYNQLEILKAGNTAEQVLFFVDQSASNSLDNSIFKLGLNGGFYDEGDCGDYKSFNIWRNKNSKCKPLFGNNLGLHVQDELDDYLLKYPSPGLFQSKNYLVAFKNNKLIGQPIQDVKLDLYDQGGKIFGNYIFSPSFATNVDLSFFDDIFLKANEIYDICNVKDDYMDCVEAQLVFKGLDSQWNVNFDSGYALFEVDSGEDVIIYSSPGIRKEKIIVKFALVFEGIFEEVKKIETNLIFIPINWGTTELDFNQKSKESFDYFIESSKSKNDKNIYNPIYKFDKLEIIDYDDLTKVVNNIENHVNSLDISYDKDKDVIIAFTEESHGDSAGFVHPPYNQVAFSAAIPVALSHELGHALYGYCEEYLYLEIKCPDSIENLDLIEDLIKENVEEVIYLVLDDVEKGVSGEEALNRILDMQISEEYVNSYPDTEEGTSKMLGNLMDAISLCELDGWLPQNYRNKYYFGNFKSEYSRTFNGCQNQYPICCIDSPIYDSSTPDGINCFPEDYDISKEKQQLINEIEKDSSITEEEKINIINMPRGEFLELIYCAGSSCGPNCRDIMGPYDLRNPITLRQYAR